MVFWFFFFFTWGRNFLIDWWILAPLQDLCNLTAFNQIVAEHILAVGVATEYVLNEYKSRFFHVSPGKGNHENVSLLVLKPLAGINVF